ncbi:hypothetical protein M8J75_013344 [Diaphorina citri]|nr:hypothetical protein M8J75_013344 [Diaphorina citri]
MVLALKGLNFTMVACDTILSNPQSLIIVKNNLTKYHLLQDNFLLITTGVFSDVRVLIRFIKAEMQLHEMRFGKEYSHHELVHKIRMILAEHFTWEPMQIIATYYNEKDGAQIKVLDGAKDIQSVNYVGQGMLGTEVCTSCIQPIYRPNLTEDQAYLIMLESMKILMTRVPINFPVIKVVVVNKLGVQERPDILG